MTTPTTTIEGNRVQVEQQSPAFVRAARLVYAIGAGLFGAGVVMQVFFIGLTLLVDPAYLDLHRAFGSILGLLPIALLPLGLLARLPWRLLGLTVLLIGLFVLQYVFLYAPAGLGVMELRALHAVNTFALIGTAATLARGAAGLLRAPGVRR